MKLNKKQIKELNRLNHQVLMAKAIYIILHLNENKELDTVEAITNIFDAIHYINSDTANQDTQEIYNLVMDMELLNKPLTKYKS